MITCCGHTVSSIEEKHNFCRAHCKEISGCYGIDIDELNKVLYPEHPRRIIPEPQEFDNGMQMVSQGAHEETSRPQESI